MLWRAKTYSQNEWCWHVAFHKNARRLAVTETNTAYRTADHERWQQLDFVIGQRVLLSNNHTLNGHPFEDICDELSGKEGDTSANRTAEKADVTKLGTLKGKGSNGKGFYPKNFKFTGWHPLCRCHVVPVMLTPDEIQASTQAMLNGEEYTPQSEPITEMPKEYKEWAKDNATRIEKALNNNTAPDFILSAKAAEEKPVRKTALEIARERHDARTPEQIEEIKVRAAERQKKHALIRNAADNILKVAKDYGEVDYNLQTFINNGELTKMATETKSVAQQIVSMKKQEQALSDIIPNVHEWHKLYPIAELEQTFKAVETKLSSWSSLTLEEQAKKLNFEAVTFLGGNLNNVQSKYATWKVSQSAYFKQLSVVNTKIAIKKVENDLVDVENWAALNPKSKKVANLLEDAKQAIKNGEELSIIQNKANTALKYHRRRVQLLARRNAKKNGGVTFGAKAYSKKRKDAAMWAHDTQEADDNLRDICGTVWNSATDEEKDAIYGYTYSYHNIQEPLRGLTYFGSPASTQLGLKRIPLVESIVNKSSYDFDMWLQRGDGMVALKKFGLSNFSTATDEEIMALVGKTGTEGGFWSTGVAKGKGFSGEVIFNIYTPKGTKVMYCEPFSYYGTGGGRAWDGISKLSTFGYESEALLQRGTTFKITKVEKSGGTWFIDVDIVEQNPLPFPYVGGYPYL